MSKSLFIVAAIALVLTACAQHAASSPATAPATARAAAAGARNGDAAHGHQVFAENCAVCHGAGGTAGPIGPSLHNEKTRKNTAQTIVWIKNPEPPMPKLYPSPLTDRDVRDVAAYVQSL